MMNKMGWQQGKTLGKTEDNPMALLTPLQNSRTGIAQITPNQSGTLGKSNTNQ